MLIDDIKNIKETKKDLRKFGLTVGIVLVILALLLFWFNKPTYHYFGGIGLFLVLSAFLFPVILRPLNKIWMTLAIILGWVMTRVILTILFYLVLTPVGFMAKLFRKDFLDLGFNKNADTYWIKRESKKKEAIDYERQF